jgi:probable rRNA maturation factor
MILIEPPYPSKDPTEKSRRTPALGRRALAAFLAAATEAVELQGQVTVLLTDDATVRRLNREFRHKDKSTDVLSFPAAEPVGEVTPSGPNRIAGDLAISLDTATRQAESFGHPLETEIRILILHGLLHLAGFDHETDTGQMARRETRLRRQFELPASLIERTSQSGDSRSSAARGKSASRAAQSRRSRK